MGSYKRLIRAPNFGKAAFWGVVSKAAAVTSRFWAYPLALFALAAALCSCAGKIPVEFQAPPGAALYGVSRAAASGNLPLSKPRVYRYVFDPPLLPQKGASLEIAYLPLTGEDDWGITLNLGDQGLWELPGETSFLGPVPQAGELRYILPLMGGSIGEFTIETNRENPDSDASPGEASFTLLRIEVRPRMYGFFREGKILNLTPFTYLSEEEGAPALIIDPPTEFRGLDQGGVEIIGAKSPFELTAGTLGIRYRGSPGDERWNFPIPPAYFSEESFPLALSPGTDLQGFVYQAMNFRGEPIPADPGLIFDYPPAAWRDPRYEIFRWSAFPEIVIFDTADYRVQERLFKRLAFFVEKAGYRGRLLTDGEMEGLHGWNAHDYRAEDLARFFETAGRMNFPLSREERDLLDILLEEGIIILAPEGDLKPGRGAVISISQESAPYLRRLFMVHEGFHGIFFIDEDFRNFSQARWDGLDPEAKRFIRSYLDSQRYDLNDPYLTVNEFMSYCLQQPVSEARRYFGETLARRIYANEWRRTVLPPMDEETETWPTLGEAFARESAAFSAYAARRWGLAAGRVHTLDTSAR